MAGLIPPEFIDRLLSQADIVEVVGSRIALKKTGHEFQACCPFHHEKTPSFTVSPTKQFYHCFGCGAHGSALSFIMEYNNLPFPDAVEELAHSMGIEVPRDNQIPQGPDHRPLYDLLEDCRKLYCWNLRKHPDAHKAVDYLKQRGLSGEIAQRYQIGYAPAGWDNLLKTIGSNAKRIDQLYETGMITRHEQKQYDRFRDRVMFPIRDRRGRVIGFGGRILTDEKPKYLNSPETPIFHKGSELYGLYEARQENKTLDRILVVEGYMDVVAVAQFGISYAVASLGTATTEKHLDLLFRSTQHIVFCFDGDRAGRDAGWKALQISLPFIKDGRQVSFLFMPDGEDPDTLIRKIGKQAFEQAISDAQPLSEYLIESLSAQTDMRSLDGRAHFSAIIHPFISKIPEGIFKDLMLQRINELTGSRPQPPGKPQTGKPKRQQKSIKTGLNTIPPVRRAIILMMHFPERCRAIELPDALYKAKLKGMDLFHGLYSFINNHEQVSLGAILEHWRDTPHAVPLNKIAAMRPDILQDDVASQFSGTFNQIIKLHAEQEWQSLIQNKSPSELSEEEKQRLKELQSARSIE